MPVIVTFTPLQPPSRMTVEGHGRLLSHGWEDVQDRRHQQRLPLGSVRGGLHLNALCLHCGSHFVWVEDEAPSEPASHG